jgi:hypothetical protein
MGFYIGYNEFCCKKCSVIYSNSHNRDKINDKRRSNTLEKYGVKHTSMLPSVKDKLKKTNLEIYGFTNSSLDPSVSGKRKQTMIDRYGVEYSGQSPEIMKKMMDTRLIKYNEYFRNLYPLLNIQDIVKERELYIKCDLCSETYLITAQLLNLRYNRYNIIPCLNCNPLHSYKYSGQNEINDHILSLGIDTIIGDRKVLGGKEIDILIPSLNIGIEFNGLYWHSDLHHDKQYHLNKKEQSYSNGIKLIHIWEDDWLYKKEIVLSRINNLLGINETKIYARKCVIKELKSNEVKDFLNTNHLQGFIKSSFNVGLYHNELLVSIMTFGKYRRSLGRKSIDGEWELYRFCSLLNTNVIGSFSKLLKYFEKKILPKKIITYANYDWSFMDNNVYLNNGLEYNGKSEPNYWYFNKENMRKHRFAFRKDKLVKEGFDPSLTEYEIMTNNGYNRIYDCGSLRYCKIYY